MANSSGNIGLQGLKLNLVREFRKAMEGSAAGALSEAAAVAEALSNQIGNRADVAEIHRQVAAEMRLSIVDAYETNVEERKEITNYGPREGSPSRLQGIMRQVLKDEDMVVGNAQGIVLGNSQLLDGAAKHIWRLNFGTQGAGDHGPPARAYPVQLFGEHVFSVGIRGTASPPIIMPPGLWLGGKTWYSPTGARRGSGDIFFPTHRMSDVKAGKPTRAVAARRFLDRGLFTLSQQLEPGYDRMLAGWLARNSRAGQIFVNVRNGRPSNFR